MEIFFLILSFLVTFILIKFTIPFFKKGLQAKPSSRGMHNIPKPTGAGICFSFVISILGLIRGSYLPIISLPLSLISLLDDKFNLNKLVRYSFQVIFVLFTYNYLLIKNELFIYFENPYINLILIFISIILGTAIINFINFMDGIDGLVSGCLVTIFLIVTIKGNYNFSTSIGAIIAFLIFNWYPSKIFMGDSGSIFLGSFVVSVALRQENVLELLKFILLFCPLLLDASICIFRRLINRQNILKAHKLHLYQRLVSNGFKHSEVSFIYIASTLFIGLNYLFLNLYFQLISIYLILLIGIYLDKKYALKF